MLGTRHVGIVVYDITSSKKFYEGLGFKSEQQPKLETGQNISNVLGFEKATILTLKMVLNENNFSLWREGGFRLELIQFLEPVNHTTPLHLNNIVGKAHLSFSVANLEDSLGEIVRLGGSVPFPSRKTQDGRHTMVYAVDPNGVPLELISCKDKSLHN